MKIKSKYWKMYAFSWVSLVLALLVISIININDLWAIILNSCLILAGLSGIVLALFARIGIIEIIYSENDRKHIFYAIEKYIAENERSIWGNLFSDKYYRTYDYTGNEVGPRQVSDNESNKTKLPL